MGLIERDKCERSVKNQDLKVEQVDFMTSLQLSREKQLVKRATCRAHDWKIKSHARLDFSRLSHG